MKRLSLLFLSLALPCFLSAQTKTPPTLKSILLEQLHTTHDVEDWFVPANIAVAGLTPEQASWTPGKGNHSVGQLTVHLIFWNREQLAKFKGEAPPKYSGDNNETFNSFDAKSWPETVKELDSVLKGGNPPSNPPTNRSSSPGIPSSPASPRTMRITLARSSMCANCKASGIPTMA